MSYAILDGDRVVNIAEAEPDFALEQGWPLLPPGFGLGDLFDGESFLHPAVDLDARRSDLLARLAQKRWEVETGGVEVMGINVRTDEVGQSKLTGAIVAMDNDPSLTSIDWEAQPGVWVTLDQPTISALSYVVARHVQACFSRARVVSEAIQAADTHPLMDAAEAEIGHGWPE